MCKPILIPTVSRSKISHSLSWPIGAEALSSNLVGIPQYDELHIQFYSSKFGPMDSALPPILKFQYVKHASTGTTQNSEYSQGLIQRHWRILVFPVNKKFRHFIKMQAIPHLPVAKAWFQKRADVDQIGSDELAFVFDTRGDRIKLVESSNMSPISAARKR